MIRLLSMGVAFALGLSPSAQAETAALPVPTLKAERALTPAETRVQGCLFAAAEVYRLPPALILILLKVEGGRLGAVSGNTNETVDIGPMQVNTIWVPAIAKHWRTTKEAAFLALRDNFCANIEGGSWILRQALDEAHGDFWSGVGIYHSHNPVHKDAYLKKVLQWTIRLREEAKRTAIAAQPLALTEASR